VPAIDAVDGLSEEELLAALAEEISSVSPMIGDVS
jgi:hypothetical protein